MENGQAGGGRAIKDATAVVHGGGSGGKTALGWEAVDRSEWYLGAKPSGFSDI